MARKLSLDAYQTGPRHKYPRMIINSLLLEQSGGPRYASAHKYLRTYVFPNQTNCASNGHDNISGNTLVNRGTK